MGSKQNVIKDASFEKGGETWFEKGGETWWYSYTLMVYDGYRKYLQKYLSTQYQSQR